MNEPTSLPEHPVPTSHFPHPTSFPPREGWKFFLLWMAGEVFLALATHFSNSITTPIPVLAGGDWNTRLVNVLWQILYAGWTGYLLFRPGWRLVWWVLLPLPLGLVVAPALQSGQPSGALLAIAALSLVAIVIATIVLLASVRRRPWAWLVAALIATSLVWVGHSLIALPPVNELLEQLAGSLPTAVAPHFITTVHAGLSLLGNAASTYVLAFWMPPIERESQPTSSPPPDSTAP